jgi:hypothetical protein
MLLHTLNSPSVNEASAVSGMLRRKEFTILHIEQGLRISESKCLIRVFSKVDVLEEE